MNQTRLKWSLAAAVAAYSVFLVAWIGPDPWMWRIWAGVIVVLGMVVGGLVFIARQDDDETPTKALLVGMVPGVVATCGFAVVAVLAAVLETRSSETLNARYWALGFGMLLIVALYLASYDRRRRPSQA